MSVIGAVARDSLVYGVASLFNKGLAFALVPIYTRALVPAAYGALDLITTLGVLVSLTVALEVAQGLGRFYGDADETGRSTLLSTAWWFSVSAYATFLAVAWAGAPWFATHVLHSPDYGTATRVGAATIALNGLLYFLLSQFRWQFQARSFAAVSALYAALVLLFVGAFGLVWNLGLTGILVAQAIATVLTVVVALRVLDAGVRFSFDRQVLWDMLRFSLPLVPAGLAVFISMYFNRLALVEFRSLQEVGAFALVNRISGAVTLLVVGIQGALTPLIYRHHNEPDTPRELARLFTWFCTVSLFACLALTLYAQDLLRAFAPATYSRGGDGPVLVAMLAPGLLLAQLYVFAPGIAIAKKTVVQLFVVVMAGIVSLVLNLALVPSFGTVGAATATVCSGATMFAAWVGASQRFYVVPFEWLRLSGVTLGFAAASCAGIVVSSRYAQSTWNMAADIALLASYCLVVIISRAVTVTELRRVASSVRLLAARR